MRKELTGDFQLIGWRLLDTLMYAGTNSWGSDTLMAFFHSAQSYRIHLYLLQNKDFSISAKLKMSSYTYSHSIFIELLSLFQHLLLYFYSVFFMEPLLISPESYSICLSGVTQLTFG